MTCNEAQPFVLCPSPETRGIERVNDMFACIPPFETVIDAHQGINFKPTEIDKFVPADTDEEADEVTINGGAPEKIERGIQIEEDKRIALKFNGKIKI
ncbi:hypothetical protein AVEN_33804-1 [Araneus ventricosus]|nr:hypothetical protein AVEN_33804-1 [Araneus ventricosus]